MAVDLVALQKLNDKRWKAAKITRATAFDKIARKAFANKQRYVEIARLCRKQGSNMPDSAWAFIAVIHNRESSMDFTTHLGQGDPLNKRTVRIPAGRGPFFGSDAFERGAVDALIDCAPKAALANKDWSISGILTYLERYNGLGYSRMGIPSPYLWAGTNQYSKGKYIADGVFSATAVDRQLGCAGLLLAIDALDKDIDYGAIAPDFTPAPPEVDKVPEDGVFDTVWLQWALNQLGAVPQLRVDGIYGGGTRKAVSDYQTSRKLVVDGKAGSGETIPSIKANLKKLGKPLFPTKEAAKPVATSPARSAWYRFWWG